MGGRVSPDTSRTSTFVTESLYDITPLSTALPAAEYSRPAMPDDCPVASDEQEDDSTDTQL